MRDDKQCYPEESSALQGGATGGYESLLPVPVRATSSPVSLGGFTGQYVFARGQAARCIGRMYYLDSNSRSVFGRFFETLPMLDGG